jgi:hypothetical protein
MERKNLVATAFPTKYAYSIGFVLLLVALPEVLPWRGLMAAETLPLQREPKQCLL